MKTLVKGLCVLLILISVRVSGAINIQRNGSLNYTPVLNSGPVSVKYDIVFVGDGFTAAQQAAFNTAVDQAVQALRDLQPYGSRMCAFNIWRVNVVSAQSGVDHPADGVFVNTELDCRYGNPAAMEAERCITSSSPAKCYEAGNFAPAADAVFVLVNDTQWGGCAGGLVFSSISEGFAGIITHELGHKVGGLADEYDCYMCDGTDDNRTYQAAWGEPAAKNLTINTNRSTIKWGSFINATTPLPTTSNVPAGVVGLWEGGGYYRFGIYRSQFNCQMRDLNEFCAACNQEMNIILTGKCTPCEIDPAGLLCAFLKNLDRFKWVNWRCRFRWPIPGCPFCPPDFSRDDIIRVVLEGIDPREFNIQVIDATGKVVTMGQGSEKGIELSFSRRSGSKTNYFVEISAKSEASQGKVSTVKTNLFINNKEVAMY
jgi:hypothetical protein